MKGNGQTAKKFQAKYCVIYLMKWKISVEINNKWIFSFWDLLGKISIQMERKKLNKRKMRQKKYVEVLRKEKKKKKKEKKKNKEKKMNNNVFS